MLYTEKIVEKEPESNKQRNINESGFRAYYMGPVGTDGPRMADESNNIDNLAIGILGYDQEFIKYSNPYLLGYLFSTLYPEGQRFYSKEHGIIEVDKNQRIQYDNGKLGFAGSL